MGKDQIFEVTKLGKHSFHVSNPTEYFRTVNYGGEPLSLAAFLGLLTKSDVVWDIGASVGLYTVHAAEHAKSIIAFEPDPQIFCRLQLNVEENGLRQLVTPMQMAIGASSGEIQLHSDGVDGYSPSIAPLGRHSGTTNVPLETIDSLTKTLPMPTVVKMDIEGAEAMAIAGSTDFLSSENCPRLFFLELHPQFLNKYDSSAEQVLANLNCTRLRRISYQKRDNEEHHIFARFDL